MQTSELDLLRCSLKSALLRCAASMNTKVFNSRIHGLNPCFSGRCTAIIIMSDEFVLLAEVLILVLVEDALRDFMLESVGKDIKS